MSKIENPLFNSESVNDILTKLRFLERIDIKASNTLQNDVRKILEETKNTSKSFINAYKKISIATHKIFYEKLNELRTLNVFDETIAAKQKNMRTYAQVIQEILSEMTTHACKKGSILTSQDEIKAQLKTLQPEIIQMANLAAANSTAALLIRPGWLALASLACISNPVTATAVAAVFFATEIYKITHELFDLKAKEPSTYLGISRGLWSKHSNLSEESKILRINEALITDISRKNQH